MNTHTPFDINTAPSFWEFLKRLFVADFMPHGHCFFWRPEIVWLHVVSDSLIALSYYSIPLTLLYFIRKRRDLPFVWLFIAFGVFIVACGTTHIMDVWTLWIPTYRLDGVIRAFTALVSVATAIVIVPIIPKALALRSPTELEKANRELEAANKKILEHERLKSDFFSNISHELRTPLTLIFSPLESLLAGEYGPVAPEQKKVLETMHNNTTRLLQMVQGLLDFQKLEAGKVEVNREATDIVALTQSLLNDFRAMIEKRGLRLRVEVGKDND